MVAVVDDLAEGSQPAQKLCATNYFDCFEVSDTRVCCNRFLNATSLPFYAYCGLLL